MTAPGMRDLAEVLRDGTAQAPALLAALSGGPRTIPELAETLHRPPWEVTLWVMSLRRYGRVVELPKDAAEDYYRYRAVEGGR